MCEDIALVQGTLRAWSPEGRGYVDRQDCLAALPDSLSHHNEVVRESPFARGIRARHSMATPRYRAMVGDAVLREYEVHRGMASVLLMLPQGKRVQAFTPPRGFPPLSTHVF